MNKTARQGIFFLFIFLFIPTGVYALHMTWFEILMILCLAQIIAKLTDLEDTIQAK